MSLLEYGPNAVAVFCVHLLYSTSVAGIDQKLQLSPETIKKLSLYRAVFSTFFGREIRGVIE